MTRPHPPHSAAHAGPAAEGPARLTLDWLLAQLAHDGLLDTAAAARLAARQPPALPGKPPRQPLLAVADGEPDDARGHGKLSLETLLQWLATRAGLPFVRIDPLSIDVARITGLAPYAYATRAQILPLAQDRSGVTIAVADPFALDWRSELEAVLKTPVHCVLADPRDIERYRVEFYALARSVKASGLDRARQNPVNLRNFEQLVELGRRGQLDANDQHVVTIVDWLLQYAFEARASDIHLEPRRDTAQVRFRIDGVLHEVYTMTAPVMAAVCSRLKIVARMDVAEKRRPQDGRIKTRTPEGREIELRVASLPTAFGEKLVLRIFNPDIVVNDLGALGFGDEEHARWQSLVQAPHGIVLVTGPTGSGKTTTLYATLKQLATPEVNVCTIEDPIEMIDPALNQMQVQPAIDLGFADGVRALLRQDPDIIMIGEIRDLDTAEVAVQAALTGHLVLSSLHTNDAPSALTRLLELGVPPYLLKATLNGVLAQRLLRRLCPHCKRAALIDATTWSQLSAGCEVPRPPRVYTAVGCLECRQTGYLGRIGVYELLSMTAALRALIGSGGELGDGTAALRRAAQAGGMRCLRAAACATIAAGETTVAEALALTPAADGDG